MEFLNPDAKTSKFRDNLFGPYIIKDDFLSEGLLDDVSCEIDSYLKNYPDRCHDQTSRKRIVVGSEEWRLFTRESPSWARLDRFLKSEAFLSWWINEMSGMFEEEYPELARGTFRPLSGIRRRLEELTTKLIGCLHREHLHLQADLSFARAGYEVGPHHDNERKRLVGLLYLGTFPNSLNREESGGDLLLLTAKSNAITSEKLRRNQEQVDDRFEEIARVRPIRNRVCFFVNTTSALHAVTRYRDLENLRVFLYFSVCAQNKNIQSLRLPGK